jgi:hypothetical protein
MTKRRESSRVGRVTSELEWASRWGREEQPHDGHDRPRRRWNTGTSWLTFEASSKEGRATTPGHSTGTSRCG